MSCPGVCRVVGRTPGMVGSKAQDDPRRGVRAALHWENESVRKKRFEMEDAVLAPLAWCSVAVCVVDHAKVSVMLVEPE